MRPFTPRELEIIRMLGSGLSVKEVAVRLGVGVPGVRFHIRYAASKIEDRGPALRKVVCYGYWLVRRERETNHEEAA